MWYKDSTLWIYSEKCISNLDVEIVMDLDIVPRHILLVHSGNYSDTLSLYQFNEDKLVVSSDNDSVVANSESYQFNKYVPSLQGIQEWTK